MNERIRELKKQAEKFVLDIPAALEPAEFDAIFAEKFAELIVRGCLHNMENCDGDLDFAIWKTKKDFGVEE
jgi:hypothetical protein